MCQTDAPRSRNASVIAAANRPEETLVNQPHVVHRRDRPAAGHDHVHRPVLCRLSLVRCRWSVETAARKP